MSYLEDEAVRKTATLNVLRKVRVLLEDAQARPRMDFSKMDQRDPVFRFELSLEGLLVAYEDWVKLDTAGKDYILG